MMDTSEGPSQTTSEDGDTDKEKSQPQCDNSSQEIVQNESESQEKIESESQEKTESESQEKTESESQEKTENETKEGLEKPMKIHFRTPAKVQIYKSCMDAINEVLREHSVCYAMFINLFFRIFIRLSPLQDLRGRELTAEELKDPDVLKTCSYGWRQ